MKNRLRRFVRLWIDLFERHALLGHASAIAFQVLKSLIPLTLLGVAILGATGELAVFLVLIGYVYTSSIILMVSLELDELLREDATYVSAACSTSCSATESREGEETWQTSPK